jgi:hypothetical protein
MLFAGEYLYYKVYTLNTETEALSNWSEQGGLPGVGRGGWHCCLKTESSSGELGIPGMGTCSYQPLVSFRKL